ncbi:MAG TPA: AHH domain-containing protein [Longimicrobiales bacterium]
MTDLGELVTIAFILDSNIECPFKEEKADSVEEDGEDIKDDDASTEPVAEAQENNGGKLGQNLSKGLNGSKGTWNAPAPEEGEGQKSLREDSKPDGKLQVSVDAAGGYSAGWYPFIQAAHHLIPGNGSLTPSKLYKTYMVESGKVTAGGVQFTMEDNIGYNVNGAHNGVWLPGNYAIRKKKDKTHASPDKGKSWSDLPPDWQVEYMEAAMEKSKGQFHDAHTTYNENIRSALDKLFVAIEAHQAICEECQKGGDKKIPPPYFLKGYLYGISEWLKAKLGPFTEASDEPPSWYTSDAYFGFRWGDDRVAKYASGSPAKKHKPNE